MSDSLVIRELTGDDLYPLLGIVAKLDILDSLVELFAEQPAEGETVDLRARGVKAVGTVGKALLVNIGTVRDDLNRFLAEVTGTKPADIKKLSIGAYIGLVRQLATRPELTEVFTSAASSTAAVDEDMLS